MLAAFFVRRHTSKKAGKGQWPVSACICRRIWYFLRISFMYDNLTDCIRLHPSDNQPYCNIQGWKIHDLLCCCKYAKPYCKYCNVEKITKDSNKLESHIREIDTAMQEVESSNQQLVDNMEKVSDIVVNHDLMYQWFWCGKSEDA